MPDGAAGQGTPTSGRHSGPQGRGRFIAVRLHGAQAWGPQRCERCLPFQCTDHAERWDSRREGTTSELGVLPAARLRRAVPTAGRPSSPGGGSLACASFQCTDHAERWDSRREGTTSELGVLPAARLRRAVPTAGRPSSPGGGSLACASFRLVAWAPCAMFSVRVAPSATRRALPSMRNAGYRTVTRERSAKVPCARSTATMALL